MIAPVLMRRTFAAMENRNYRLFFTGQIISVSGTWMQGVAQAWLVLKLTGSGSALGLVVALQTLPILLGGAWGGLVADRANKRRLLLATQSVAAVLALTLGVLTLTGVVRLWMVAVLAIGLGGVNLLDLPARQAFVLEMVGRKHLTNAISLNSVIMNGARVVGPAAAGILIATVGIAACFLVNAASFLAVIAGLALIRDSDLFEAKPVVRGRGQLMAGFRYVWSTPELLTPLLMMALVGTFAYEFQVTLPLLSRYTFHAGSVGFGAMSSSMGAGAVVGGLFSASRSRPTGRRLAIATALFGACILLAAAAPNLVVELLLMAVVGAASIAFAAMANSTLQLASEAEMRGRVMALYAVAFMGTTPFGGLAVGWIGQTYGPRQALATGGFATLAAAALGWRSLTRGPRTAERPALIAHGAPTAHPAPDGLEPPLPGGSSTHHSPWVARYGPSETPAE